MSTTNANTIDRGMILCAGLGTRMAPLTLQTPKPLINVAGRPLVEYGMKNLEKAGVGTTIVNVHYLAEQVLAWARDYQGSKIIISDETEELLETGGGVCHARELLGSEPVCILNADSFWLDKPKQNSLSKMIELFDRDKCDFLLMLTPHANGVGFTGAGDFFCDLSGRLSRRGKAAAAPYIYAGCYIVNPAVLDNCPKGKFSMNLLWDRAIENNRLYGFTHDGLWLHVGTVPAIEQAEIAMANFDHDPL